MRLRRVTWTVCAVFGFASCAIAQETVKLEYKLQPGTELIYKVSGTIKMSSAAAKAEGATEGTMTGPVRFVVADVDAASGVMLIGQLPQITLALKAGTPQGGRSETLRDVSVCRMDRSGNPVPRKSKGEEKSQGLLPLLLMQFDPRPLDPVPLPAGAVAVGAVWEGATDAAVPGYPLSVPSKVTSTLAEIKSVDGHRCALIKSKLSPSGKKLGGIVDVEVNGDVETLFDLDGGFYRSGSSKLILKASQPGQEPEVITFETAVQLDSVKELPPEAAAREAGVIRVLDAAITDAFAGEYDRAADALENLKPAEVPDAWKAGVNKTITTVKQIAEIAKGGVQMAQEADPAGELYSEADRAATEQKWADAVAKYKQLAEKYPEHPLASSALARAAAISETKLNDKSAADALRAQAVALQEKRAAAGDPVQLYKLAATCAEAGDLEKAVATYRKFLAAESDAVPANLRLMAQYRIAGLLEKQGKTAEAVEAYKAAAAMPGDDEYSMKIKSAAQKKAEALGAPAAK
jgi:hypothetical protein